MRFSAAIVALTASVVSATYYDNSYGYNDTATTDASCYTTIEVVSQYSTYCSEATTYVEGTATYHVTKPTMLTVTDCPYGCTITKTYSTEASASTPTPYYGGKPTGNPSVVKPYPAPPPKGTGSPSYPHTNSTKPTYTKSSPTESPLTGAAGRVTVAGGALGGLFAIMVYLL